MTLTAEQTRAICKALKVIDYGDASRLVKAAHRIRANLDDCRQRLRALEQGNLTVVRTETTEYIKG